MTRFLATAALAGAAAFGVGFSGAAIAASPDLTQLEANVGLTPAQARPLTLTEIAAMEFDRSSDDKNQMIVIHPANTLATPEQVTMSSRSPTTVNAQLISGAGLSQHKADTMTLNDVTKAKFARDNSL